jgi:polyhydroxyalkanoate synthesis regulator phasin
LASLIRAGSQRMSTIQRSLFTSVGFMRLIDGEIRRRIQVLIRLGELAEADGKSLLEKLLAQSQAEAGQAQPSDAQAAGDDLGPEPDDLSQEVEAILKERNIPTRADLDQIAAQLDALSVKLDSFRPNP